MVRYFPLGLLTTRRYIRLQSDILYHRTSQYATQKIVNIYKKSTIIPNRTCNLFIFDCKTQDKLNAPTLVKCPVCGEMKQPHHACPNCGSVGSEKTSAKAGE